VIIDGYPRAVRGVCFALLVAVLFWVAVAFTVWWWLG
jgi:hypothetical protein